MAREKPTAWGCGHPFPIEVVPLGGGRRARCLACDECGPVRPDSEGARRALKGAAGHRGRVGALRGPVHRTSENLGTPPRGSPKFTLLSDTPRFTRRHHGGVESDTAKRGLAERTVTWNSTMAASC